MILAAAWWHPILAVLFAFLALMLMGVILLQRGKGVGLAGAFGGAGASTAFGAKTGDFLTWATVVMAGVFLLYAVLCNYAFVPPSAGFAPPAAAVAPIPSGTAGDEGDTGTGTPGAPAQPGPTPPPTPPQPGSDQPLATQSGGGIGG